MLPGWFHILRMNTAGQAWEQGWTRARGQPEQANNLAPSKRYSLNICQHSSRGEAGCCVAGEDTEECWFSTHPLAARLPALNTPYPAAKRPGRQPRHCDEIAPGTTSTSMRSPGAGMVLENFPALKQEIWTLIIPNLPIRGHGLSGWEV